MADGSQAESLASTQHIVVVLRLVVEASGQVLYGEVVDPAGVRGDRFVGLAGIGEAVRTCLPAWIGEASRGGDHDRGSTREPSGAQHGPVG